MDSPLISVVTPIHNAERYLSQCLESLVAQTFEHIEFICIDDGSTDSSAEILQKFTNSDSRFRALHQDNVGYGCTMNRGIELAQGRYVGFLDADDFAEPNMFETLYELAVANEFPDIVKADYFMYSSANDDKVADNNLCAPCEEKLSVADERGRGVLLSAPAIWAALYRLEFLRENLLHLTEASGVAYQDTAFVHKAWIAADSFVLTGKPLVHYRVDNPDSSVKAPGNVFRVCEEFDMVEAFAQESVCADEILPYVFAKRFRTYEWNARRLQDVEREQFVERVSADFGARRAAGTIDESCLTEAQSHRLNMLIERPFEYYAWLTYGQELERATKRESMMRSNLDKEKERARQQEDCANQLEERASRAEDHVAELQARLELLEEKSLQLTASIDEANRELEKCRERETALEAELAQERDSVVLLEAERDKRQARIDALESCNSYRIGRACTWLPRKVKRVIKGRRSAI